jgi:hypothetical protein
MAEQRTMSKETMSRQTSSGGEPRRGLRRAIRSAALAGALGVVAAAILAPPAFGDEAITGFSVSASEHKAGGHPDLGMSFSLGSPGSPESAQNVIVHAPEGIFGNPNAITQCNSVDFALEQCPPASQAGFITIHANYEHEASKLLGTAPIFDLQSSAEETALFAFIVPKLNIPVSIPVTVRTSADYGLDFSVAQLTQSAPLASADIELWGYPADPSHDAQRFPKGSPGSPAGCAGGADTSCITKPVPAQIGVRPLINNPTDCTGETLTATLEVQTYQDPEHPTTAQASYPEVEDCFNMIFKPVLYVNPTTSEADAPSGLDLKMVAPQPLGRATTPSPIHSATLVLPPGFTINPDAADGQSSCSDTQANFQSSGPAECPDNAKIGTFSIGSPSLDGRLEGSIYIGEPTGEDQYRIFLVADGFGIHAKYLGIFRPDPVSGQVTAYIKDLPQAPFEDFELHLFASDRGLMATPTKCDIYETDANFLPWNSDLADVTSRQLFDIEEAPHGAPCPGPTRPFKPRLIAGNSDPGAGGFSSFALQLDREDGDQFLGALNFTMPPGFTGSLRGIEYCPEASIAAAAQTPGRTELALPSCPESSLIGTTDVAAGPGSHPFHAAGRIYMAGPFKGAPLSIVAITPALAGPYDYGTQVVRVAIHVDPLDAHVTALSDAVPTIIGGVPLRLRMIRVNLNRSKFIINPTNCDPMAVHSEGVGDEGTAAGFDSYFHAVNCFALGFRPKITITKAGRGSSNRGGNPSLQFDLRTRSGDANVKSLSVTLPNAFEIDQEHLGNICTEKELAATQCAGRQKIGDATTTTPLLDQPLSGPVYAVSGSGGLPRLAFILDGQVNLLPRAETKTGKQQRLRTTVPIVPDAPIGDFHLTILGGGHGYLSNTRNLCVHVPVVSVAYEAQNGKTYSQRVKVKIRCGGKAGRKARALRHHR